VQAQKLELTFLTTAGELRIIDLDGVSSVKLADDRLQKLLTDALGAYQQAQSQERSRYGSRPRPAGNLLARYLVPAPMWKSAYPLASRQGRRHHRGLGHRRKQERFRLEQRPVDRRLGQPISFISRLYEPNTPAPGPGASENVASSRTRTQRRPPGRARPLHRQGQAGHGPANRTCFR